VAQKVLFFMPKSFYQIMISPERKITKKVEIAPAVKEAVLKDAWEDKRGRDMTGEIGPSLFIGLNSPWIDTPSLLAQTIRQLEASPTSFDWERCWGRVVVGVKPYEKEEVALLSPSDDRSKGWVPIKSSRLLPSQEIIRNEPWQGQFKITVNSAPMTTEGATIALTHLLGNLAWEQSLKIQEEDLGRFVRLTPSISFNIALEEIIKGGIEIRFANEDEIIAEKLANPEQTNIRLYGSRKARSVPFVLGAVCTENGFSDASPIDLTKESKPDPRPARAKEQEATPITNFACCFSVTFGKPLHAGHLLNLALCQTIAKASQSKTIILNNNNTGPRAARTLALVAKRKGISLETAYGLLTQGELPPQEIVSTYRTRKDESVPNQTLDEALGIVESQGGDVFKSLTELNRAALKRVGWPVEIISEAANFETCQKIVSVAAPAWSGCGFSAVPVRGLTLLQKEGVFTSVAKSLTLITQALLKSSGRATTALYVDSEKDTAPAVSVANWLGIPAKQIPGAGISLGLKTTSGTKGDSLTINEVVSQFQTRVPDDQGARKLRNGLVFLLSSQPCRAACPPPFVDYDFQDNGTFVSRLVACSEKAEEFLSQAKTTRTRLESLPENETSLTEGRQKDLVTLKTALESALSPQTRIRAVETSGQFTKITLGREFNKMKSKLARHLRRDQDPAEVIVVALSGGCQTATEIFEFAEKEGILKKPVPAFKNFPVQSSLVEAVQECGYTGEKAKEVALQAAQGKIKLMRRKNLFLGLTKKIIRVSQGLTAVTKEDRTLLLGGLDQTLERSGYEF
jgi:hypothetical protein